MRWVFNVNISRTEHEWKVDLPEASCSHQYHGPGRVLRARSISCSQVGLENLLSPIFHKRNKKVVKKALHEVKSLFRTVSKQNLARQKLKLKTVFYYIFRIPDRIFSRVSNRDNIETNSSTFMLEMREISFLLQHRTDRLKNRFK